MKLGQQFSFWTETHLSWKNLNKRIGFLEKVIEKYF